MMKRKFGSKGNEKFAQCNCGGSSKLGHKSNYPHGRKSKAVRTFFYLCKSCGIKTNAK